jgi:hypothetical protein
MEVLPLRVANYGTEIAGMLLPDPDALSLIHEYIYSYARVPRVVT